MQGMDDEYGTTGADPRDRAAVPHAELLELPQCGHSPHRDQPERVIDEVTRFVDAHAAAIRNQPADQPAA